MATNSRALPQFTLNRRYELLLWLSVPLNLALLFHELATWLLALTALVLVWRLVMMLYNIRQTSRWILLPLALSGCVILLLTGRELGVLLAMVHLLSFSYALKLLEIRRRQDLLQLLLLGMFVLATAFIFRQQLYFSALVFLLLLFNVTLLLLHYSAIRALAPALRISAKLLLQSIPLAVMLFILLPRLSPFWQVPLAKAAKTGLSEQVSPGDIAKLALSDELVFRVSFIAARPAFNQLYWRALVLEDYDGVRWQRSKIQQRLSEAYNAEHRRFIPALSGNAISYQVIAEASHQHWLYALKVAEISGRQDNVELISLPDYTIQSNKPLSQTVSYYLHSYNSSLMDPELSTLARRNNLRLPEQVNPRLRQEGARLRQQVNDDQQIIQQVLAHIRSQPYRYTLNPPLLNNHSLDQFYFETKAGFCAHYASAFTFLMRAAGIPARMVTGYMGGEYNASANYYSIYQYDAHAWSEVWLEHRGWVRIDATAAVSPARVESGFSAELFAEQASLSGELFDINRLKRIAVFQALAQSLQALDFQWTRWVIGYNSERQLQLLTGWFGRLNPWKMAALLFSVLSLTMAWLLFSGRSTVKVRQQQRWFLLYQKSLQQLAKLGLDKPIIQASGEFAREVARQFPLLAPEFTTLTDLFMQLHYQPLSSPERQRAIASMKSQYRRLRWRVFLCRINRWLRRT